MERYSEYYEDDARRLAQFLADECNGHIEPFYANNCKDFPQPPKVSFFKTIRVPAYRVADGDGMNIAEIAFVAEARNGDEDLLLKDRMIKRIRLGRLIAEKRKQRHLTEQQLADMIGAKRSAICGAERGKYKSDCDFLLSLAHALDCTLDFKDIR
jgi:DNA-binding XRE family transcriptional regulator